MEYVDLARAATARGEVVLRERRDPGSPTVVELRVNGVFVMDTLETVSEQGLASAALAEVDDPRAVLVGGLGLGFTAHEVLSDPRVERLAVVEIEEALVGWMRDGTVPHGPAYLADERLTVVAADIRQAISEATPASYDLVLLDVDNGPGFLVHDANAAIYEAGFLREVAAVLRPGGAVVIWSSAQAPALCDAMAEVFGGATPIPFDVRLQGRDEQYWLYLARR
jgi:spermidine synthase